MVNKNETTNSEKKPIIDNEELWDDAHIADFYTFATTLAKEWLASNQS